MLFQQVLLIKTLIQPNKNKEPVNFLLKIDK